jgi:murein DD-endopeptidase MepM/ murein hydrolase activator NlpD
LRGYRNRAPTLQIMVRRPQPPPHRRPEAQQPRRAPNPYAWTGGAIAVLALLSALNFTAARWREAEHVRELRLPIDRVAAGDLVDSWNAPRSHERHHQGIDIMAPRYTPVRAVVDGEIARITTGGLGGLTIYQFDRDRRFVFLYAHLQSRASGLAEGARVTQGQPLGAVGSSGDATTPHLHFEIRTLGAPGRWWQATALDPYPYLQSGNLPEAEASAEIAAR